jgi:hypothetical protein
MDPFTRLTLFRWQFSRRRHSRTEIIFYAAVLVISITLGLIEWAGYWPEIGRLSEAGCRKSLSYDGGAFSLTGKSDFISVLLG